MIDRLRAAWGALVAKAVQAPIQFFNTYYSAWRDAVWPRITFQTLVNDGYGKHATVFACVQKYATTFPEAPMRVYVGDGKDEEDDPDSPARALIRRPNPHMSETDFWRYFITYAAVGGLVCVWKQRDRSGRVVALWPLHRGVIGPVPDPAGWLSHWRYDLGSGETWSIPPEDIIPYRWAIDPLSPLDGLSALVACARAVDTGAEGLRYQYALLANDAVARTALVVNGILPTSVKEQLLLQFKEQYGGDNRGAPMILQGQDARVERLGASLEELGAEALHSVPDAMICSAFDVPGVLIGTAGGMQRSIQGAPREMLEYWTETARVPRWREVEEVFTHYLLHSEFGETGSRYRFDLSGVRALADDEVAALRAATDAVRFGLLMVNEGRQMAGHDPVPGGDVFLRSPQVAEVPPTGAPAPEPPALPVQAGPAAAEDDGEPPAGGDGAEASKALPLPDEVRITDGDIEDAIRLWDEMMAESHPEMVGILEAGTVTKRRNGRGG